MRQVVARKFLAKGTGWVTGDRPEQFNGGVIFKNMTMEVSGALSDSNKSLFSPLGLSIN